MLAHSQGSARRGQSPRLLLLVKPNSELGAEDDSERWSFLPTIFHVLCDNVDWLLGNNGEEADEAHVLQVLHHVGLSQEGFH